MPKKLGILGGGPGGIFTAFLLQKYANNPITVKILEASARFGGKILTPHFDSQPATYEAGAAELYDYSPVDEDTLRDLVHELGLPIVTMGGSSMIMMQNLLSNLDDIRDHLGDRACREIIAFDSRAHDAINPRAFYSSDNVFASDPALIPAVRFGEELDRLREPAAKAYIERFIHSDLATEPQATSASYGLQNYVMNDPTYMQLYAIEGGNERLPEELLKRIQADKISQCEVTEIEVLETGEVQLKAVHQGRAERFVFDAVIIALPMNALKRLTFGTLGLRNAMKAHIQRYNHPAHYLRVSLLFDRPFWREAMTDSYWMLDAFGGCCLYDESVRGGGHVLGWLLGGKQACELARLADDELMDLVLGSAPTLLGDARSHFVEGKVHRWLDAVNAIPGGLVPSSLEVRHRPDPIESRNVFVVGDYLFDSTLNGVLDSADYVARWIAAEMADSGN